MTQLPGHFLPDLSGDQVMGKEIDTFILLRQCKVFVNFYEYTRYHLPVTQYWVTVHTVDTDGNIDYRDSIGFSERDEAVAVYERIMPTEPKGA